MKQHKYEVRVTWTGDLGQGTRTYASYKRDHDISAEGRPPILGSSDPSFRGDQTRYSPEDLLVASLSACHMLWYLHLCAVNGVIVKRYQDAAIGVMEERADGSGAFVEVVLQPRVEIEEGSSEQKALALHEEAHRLCFIANSVNFAVRNEPQVTAVTSC